MEWNRNTSNSCFCRNFLTLCVTVSKLNKVREQSLSHFINSLFIKLRAYSQSSHNCQSTNILVSSLVSSTRNNSLCIISILSTNLVGSSTVYRNKSKTCSKCKLLKRSVRNTGSNKTTVKCTVLNTISTFLKRKVTLFNIIKSQTITFHNLLSVEFNTRTCSTNRNALSLKISNRLNSTCLRNSNLNNFRIHSSNCHDVRKLFACKQISSVVCIVHNVVLNNSKFSFTLVNKAKVFCRSTSCLSSYVHIFKLSVPYISNCTTKRIVSTTSTTSSKNVVLFSFAGTTGKKSKCQSSEHCERCDFFHLKIPPENLTNILL